MVFRKFWPSIPTKEPSTDRGALHDPWRDSWRGIFNESHILEKVGDNLSSTWNSWVTSFLQVNSSIALTTKSKLKTFFHRQKLKTSISPRMGWTAQSRLRLLQSTTKSLKSSLYSWIWNLTYSATCLGIVALDFFLFYCYNFFKRLLSTYLLLPPSQINLIFEVFFQYSNFKIVKLVKVQHECLLSFHFFWKFIFSRR